MSVFTANAKVILRGYKPAKFLKPKHFSIFVRIFHHVDLMLLQIPDSSLLRLLDGDDGSVLGLLLLLIRFLLDLEILADVQLG